MREAKGVTNKKNMDFVFTDLRTVHYFEVESKGGTVWLSLAFDFLPDGV